MQLLKRALYWEAAVLAAGGLFLAFFPAWFLQSVFQQPPATDAWVRIAGVQAVGFAMLAVVVAHRIEQLWWASWAFVLTGGGVAVVAGGYALVGLPEGVSPVFWGLVSLE